MHEGPVHVGDGDDDELICSPSSIEQLHRPDPPSATAAAVRTLPSRSRSQLKYIDEMDVTLLRAVNDLGAHIAAYGQAARLFDSVARQCRSNTAFHRFPHLTGKSVWDRYKKLPADFRKIDRENRQASGITEEYGEKESLFQGIADAVDDKVEHDKHQKGERAQKESRLLQAGKEMRDVALNRKVNKRGRNESPHAPKTLKDPGNPRTGEVLGGQEAELILASEERQKKLLELEEKKYATETEKLAFQARCCTEDKSRLKLEEGRVKMAQDRLGQERHRIRLDEDRLEMEIERLDLELEKAEADRAGRKAMLGLNGTLVEKVSKPD